MYPSRKKAEVSTLGLQIYFPFKQFLEERGEPQILHQVFSEIPTFKHQKTFFLLLYVNGLIFNLIVSVKMKS